MKKFKIYGHENGLTLIEVLASIVILSIVLISFSSILLQSVKHTKYNEEKLTEVDIAEEVVAEIRNGTPINTIISSPGYEISIKESKGPVEELPEFCKAEITVHSNKQTKNKKAPFITEIYFEKDGVCNE